MHFYTFKSFYQIVHDSKVMRTILVSLWTTANSF